MAIEKATLSKNIDGIMHFIYPKTSSDMVSYDGSTVEKKLQQIDEDISGGISNVEGTIGTHTKDTNNPHKVTTTQIGAAEAAEVEGARTAKSDGETKSSLNDRINADYSALTNTISGNATTAHNESQAVQTNLNTHTNNTNNPHGVTTTQIGAAEASEVEGARVAKSDDITKSTLSDRLSADYIALENKINNASSAASAGSEAVQKNLDSHTSNKSNPHGVTTTQIGAAEASEMVAARTAKSDSVVKDSLKDRIDADYDALANTISGNATTAHNESQTVQTNLNTHTGDTNNPHSVTTTQIGAAEATEVEGARVAKSDSTTKDSLKARIDTDYEALSDAIESAASTASADTQAVQTNLNTHTGDTSNPHKVTASQVGLGNVPNVTTNNQTPTYTAASTLATLTSGETLSTSMGKIQKAIADEISHIGNTSNPHKVTAAQAGAVPTARTVNGKALSADITLTPSDVGALASDANAVSATEFSSSTTVVLTGDATGTSDSSKKGWSVPVTLSKSGVTAGTYGQTETKTATHGGTVVIPNLTVDEKGRVTAAADKTITLPAETTLSKGTTTGSGNAVTDISLSNHTVTLTKGTTFATKAELDDLAATVSTSMVFKGTLGTDGTVSSLTAASKDQLGYTYKVITAGTYGGQSAKIGDVFICGQSGDGTYQWTLIPSGDEPDGTVTSITLKVGNGLNIDSTAAITTSGTRTISHADTSSQGNITAASRTYVNSVTLDDFGHVTAIGTGKETVTDTHHTSSTVVAGSDTATTDTSTALSNDGVYINHIENGTVRSSHKVTGSGATSVTTDANGNLKIASSNTTYTSLKNPNPITIKVNDAQLVKYDGSDSAAVNIAPGDNVTISTDTSGNITIAAKDTTYSNASDSTRGLMSASDYSKLSKIAEGATANTGTVTKVSTGVGLTGGDISTTGTIKAKLKSETALTADAAAQTNTASRTYPVSVDKSGYLAVNVPWVNDNTTSLGSMEGTLAVSSGGTGKSSITSGSYIVGNGTSAVTEKTPAQVLSDIGAVPTSRTVNGKALSADITLSASDVGAAASSHGTHVSYSTSNPSMDGTAAVGSASTVARSDHVHPTDTSRAAASDLTDHTGNSAMHMWYGTCSTAAATAAKVVECEGFTLSTNARISVKFTNYSTTSGITLNVNNTGDITAYWYGTTAVPARAWITNQVVDFEYDGSAWQMLIGKATTTYYGAVKLSSSTSSTSTALAATPSAVKTAYDLANGKAAVTSGTATIPASDSWTADSTSGLYTCTVSISTFTADLRAHISPVISTTDTDTGDAQQEAWDTHYFSETVAGGIKFYAKEAPTVAVEFTWEVVS